MVSQNVNKLLEQAKTLSPGEREEFIALLRTQSAQSDLASSSNDRAAELVKKGVTLTVPNPTPEQIARFKAWRPVEMPGGPLSDDIIRDRR